MHIKMFFFISASMVDNIADLSKYMLDFKNSYVGLNLMRLSLMASLSTQLK